MRGPAAARNAGAKRAKGIFLVFTDDDCMPNSDWLQKLAARCAETPNRLIGGRTLNALHSNVYSTVSQAILDIVYSYYNSVPNQARFFASNNQAIPLAGFSELNGFDPNFNASEDRDLCDRWLHCGYRMTYAPEAIVRHAHALTLPGFCRQHFNYGRGAFRFYQRRARRGALHA
jgi:GT2 family glycosyltransferase